MLSLNNIFHCFGLFPVLSVPSFPYIPRLFTVAVSYLTYISYILYVLIFSPLHFFVLCNLCFLVFLKIFLPILYTFIISLNLLSVSPHILQFLLLRLYFGSIFYFTLSILHFAAVYTVKINNNIIVFLSMFSFLRGLAIKSYISFL